MTVTLGYKGKRVALLAYADKKGRAAHPDRATHAWVCEGNTHTDGIGFDELGSPFLVERVELR